MERREIYGECVNCKADCNSFTPDHNIPIFCATCTCNRKHHLKYIPVDQAGGNDNLALTLWIGGSSGTYNNLSIHRARTLDATVGSGTIGSTSNRPPAPTLDATIGNGSVGSSSTSRTLALAAAAAPRVAEGPQLAAARKGRRSKFSVEQIAAMRAFADRVGWTLLYMRNINGQAQIQQFCDTTGVSKASFKNWMNRFKKVYDNGSEPPANADQQ